MAYVDGFVIPVPKSKLDRAHRDEVNAKAMSDPRLADMMNTASMPFDGQRMFWGGFESLVEA